jgi:release factor glutamine methyltransferase
VTVAAPEPGFAPAARSIGQALARAVRRLRAAGVPEPDADAQVLLAHVLGTSRTGLIAAARDPLPAEAARRVEEVLRRRERREPVAYIVGEREFWSLPIAVDRRVLVPRPETELLVEVARRLAPDARCVLDCGTGSGAIAAALATELGGARVCASDRSLHGLAVAAVNTARHAPHVRLVGGDLLAPFRDAAFDLVVSNPPYCTDDELATLEPEIRDFEPRVALAAGTAGLDVLHALIADGARVLVPGGWMLLEVGAGQADRVRGVFERDLRYTSVVVEHDHAGIARVVGARRRRVGTWTAS